MNSNKYKNKYSTQSTRLLNWDYGSNANYFVTICTKNREHFFGNIFVETQDFASLQDFASPRYSIIGEVANQYWSDIPKHFPFVILDEFIIMPNHIHGIIYLNKEEPYIYQTNKFAPQSRNLASIIRGFKAAVKKYATINQIDFDWQPRYYDRIVRNEDELHRIRKYIIENPANWINNKDNLENLYM